MNFTQTYSRADLQAYQEKTLKERIKDIIERNVLYDLLESAKKGETKYFWTIGLTDKQGIKWYSFPPIEKVVEGVKEKFPDTTVEYQETWIETRPGVKEQKKGILIDWS